MNTAAAATPEVERRLHPWSWLFVLLQQVRQMLVPLIALLVFGGRGDAGAYWPILGTLAVVGVLVVLSVIQFFTYHYRVGVDALTVREGWLHRSLRDIPYSRIHNVVVHQNLLHRLFGVAEVRLESAGGQKPEAHMRVLSLDQALALEQRVRQRGQGAASVAHDAAGPAAEGLLSLSTAEVIRLGLVSNRGMIVMAAAFGVAWQVFPERAMGSFIERFGRQAFGYANELQLSWMSTALAATALMLLAIALLRLLSVALALFQYHGFRLSEETRRLTVERGLLSRLRTSVARRRIQAWTLRETLLHRLLQRRSLHIDTAVAEQQGQEAGRALKELAPIALPEQCDALVQRLLPQAQWPREDWVALPAAAWWRMFVPGAVFMAILAVALTAFFATPWGLLPLAWLPWSAHVARQHALRAAYAVDEAVVAVRGGWWDRYWRFAEIDKLQALRLVRSPIDQRLGTASLWLDTAGATGSAPALQIRFLPEAQARALFVQLGHALARRRLQW